MDLPEIDSIVHVWPHPGARVYEDIDARPLRVIPAEGRKVAVTRWILSLINDGSVHLTDPAPKARSAAVKPSPTGKE